MVNSPEVPEESSIAMCVNIFLKVINLNGLTYYAYYSGTRAIMGDMRDLSTANAR